MAASAIVDRDGLVGLRGIFAGQGGLVVLPGRDRVVEGVVSEVDLDPADLAQ
jgi:hypothetical protein